MVVTHAPQLVAELNRVKDVRMIALKKEFGETIEQDGDRPNWVWPSR